MWETKHDGDWKYAVHDGAFLHVPGIAHVFEVRPHKVFSVAMGNFAQTHSVSTTDHAATEQRDTDATCSRRAPADDVDGPARRDC
jgi:hypothetical protein